MAKALTITLKTTNQLIYIDSSGKEWAKIDVIISAQKVAIQGATVSFSIVSGGTGTFDPASGSTDTYGFLTTRFRLDTAGRYVISVSASKSGYTSGSEAIDVIAVAKPTEYSSNGSLYLNLIEKRKQNILDVLRSYLDNDSCFGITTGASGKISYLTEWNYQIKDFPLIVISSNSPTFVKIGLNHFIDDSTNGGWVDVVFELNLLCEEKNILDRLTEKCVFVLSTIKFYELYGKYGMHINEIRTGDTVTEPYGAKYIFANRISLSTRLEFAYNIIANDIIEQITTTGNYT